MTAWRQTPTEIVSLINIKKPDPESLSSWRVEDIVRPLGHGERVLIHQPCRFVDVVLCDKLNIQFFQVVRDPNSQHPYSYRQSVIYQLTDRTAQLCLLALFELPTTKFAFKNFPSMPSMRTVFFLGEGSSSKVYEVSDEKSNELYVLKAHKKPDSTASMETETLSILQASLPPELRRFVPRVVKQTEDFVVISPSANKLGGLTQRDLHSDGGAQSDTWLEFGASWDLLCQAAASR